MPLNFGTAGARVRSLSSHLRTFYFLSALESVVFSYLRFFSLSHSSCSSGGCFYTGERLSLIQQSLTQI